jgi:hypothetical protein
MFEQLGGRLGLAQRIGGDLRLKLGARVGWIE